MDHTPRLTNLADTYRAAKTALDQAREALRDEIRNARADGMPQGDILRATGNLWTREQVRQITKDTPKRAGGSAE